MNTSAIPNFSIYTPEKAHQLSQQRYDNFTNKIKVGAIPVGKTDADGAQLGACWNWTASFNRKGGYGQFRFAVGRKGQAHRISAFLAGIVPSINSVSDDDQVCHRCDNKSCINPDHFFIGTHKNNMDDMVEKSRQATGEGHGMAKLTWEQVREIRTSYSAGGITQQQLGEDYGVGRALIGFVICNKIWHDPNYTPPQTRLSQEQRAEVITLYAQGGTTMQILAKQYNVGQTTIQSIIKGK